jgi:hypothetical protein
MFTKCWLVIKDDGKRTFENCGKASNDNSFSNSVYSMQKAGMNVSGVTLPVTNKTSSKDSIKIVGYTQEDGLHDRLLKEYREITLRASGLEDW